MNGGHFTYALDDPYIHLALAERLAHGHYGLNGGELTTPSSSILWPFLLVPGAGLPAHQFLPLIYNLIFGTLAAWLMGVMARDWLQPSSGLKSWSLALLLVISANLPSLTFTGMEHVLQVLTAVVCAYGIVQAYKGQPIPWWCIALVILAPAIRYESYILCVALGVTLIARRRPAAAAATLTLSLLAPGVFAIFLVQHGHPPLPNSVLVKGAAFATHNSVLANLVFTMKTNAIAYLTNPRRWPFTLAIPLLVFFLWRDRKNSTRRLILAGVLLATGLQMLAGAYGWFHRYEVFAKVLAILVVLQAASAIQRRVVPWIAAALLLLSAAPYVSGTLKTPLATNNVYQQQFQMHRFVQSYGANFAVNDLGWVSYQLKPSVYVMDLIGLASLEAMQRVDKNPAWLDDVTRRHACGLVMIYPQWFPELPKDWTPVASLSINTPEITINGRQVYFYETPFGKAEDRWELSHKLDQFAASLPPGVTFLRNPPPPLLVGRGISQIQ